jgi:hypothetical protein
MKDVSIIPPGEYCYTITKSDGKNFPTFIPCPYWSINKDMPVQCNGYCSFMEKGDWDIACGLLWDQVKECAIKIEEDDEHSKV